MSVSDPIADMLTKVRNASNARHSNVDFSHSKMKMKILSILKYKGFIGNFQMMSTSNHSQIRIFLKYNQQNRPVINGIECISTPGRRVYVGYRDMPRVLNGYGTLIVSTSHGIISGSEASSLKVGGELICKVW